jgi:hypothetical protein
MVSEEVEEAIVDALRPEVTKFERTVVEAATVDFVDSRF